MDTISHFLSEGKMGWSDAYHGFSKLLASVIDSLIRMQQHAPGFDPSVVRHLQRFSGQHASGESDSVNPTTRRAYRPKKTAR